MLKEGMELRYLHFESIDGVLEQRTESRNMHQRMLNKAMNACDIYLSGLYLCR